MHPQWENIGKISLGSEVEVLVEVVVRVGPCFLHGGVRERFCRLPHRTISAPPLPHLLVDDLPLGLARQHLLQPPSGLPLRSFDLLLRELLSHQNSRLVFFVQEVGEELFGRGRVFSVLQGVERGFCATFVFACIWGGLLLRSHFVLGVEVLGVFGGAEGEGWGRVLVGVVVVVEDGFEEGFVFGVVR